MKAEASGLVKAKQYDQALVMYEDIEELYDDRGDNENSVGAMVDQAYVCRMQGNYQEAITNASRAVYSSHNTKEAFIELGYAKYHSGDQVGAVEVCKQGIERYKNNKSIKDVLAYFYATSANDYYKKSDFKTAYNLYYSAYYYDNTYADAIKYAGHSAYNAKMNPEALQCYKIAVQLDPNLRGELAQYIDYLNSVVR